MRLYTLSVSLFRSVASQVMRGTQPRTTVRSPLPGPRSPHPERAEWPSGIFTSKSRDTSRARDRSLRTLPGGPPRKGSRVATSPRRLPTRLLRPRAAPAPAGGPRLRRSPAGGGGGRGPGAGGSRALAWPRRALPHTHRRRGENEVAQARGSAGRALTRPALVASVACRGALSCLRGQSQPVVAFRPRGPATRKATRRAAPSCVACWRGEGGARGGIPGDTEAGAAEERAGNPRG